MQSAIAGEIGRYGLAVDPNSEFEQAIWLGPEGRRAGSDPAAVFGPLFAPARPALDAAVSEIRRADAAGEGLPAEQDLAADAWIDRLDVPDETKHALLAWMAVIGGGDPAQQSILILTADLALAGFEVESTLDQLRETFRDGTAGLVEALAAEIQGEIRTGAVVEAVAQRSDRVHVTVADGLEVEARAAVVALPLNCLVDVAFDPPLDQVKRAASSQRHPGTSTKVLAVATGVEARTLAWAWDHPLQGVVGMHAVEGGTLVAGFDGRGMLRDPSDRDEIEAALRALVPSAEILACDSHDWTADPFSKGAWLSWRPGWAAEVVPQLARPEGMLRFAGSDLALEGGGYIEGAIASGREAAAAIAAALPT
jgi:monoamine oxidase